MTANRVNFDFEQALALNSPSFKNTKLVNRLEYIYFLFKEDSPLYSVQNYTSKQLGYYQDLIGQKSFVENSGDYWHWWASLDNFSHLRVINSKCYQTQWILDNDLGIEGLQVFDEKNIQFNDGLTYYHREEYGFSGLKNRIIRTQNDLKNLNAGVIAPYVEIVKSFGVTFNGDDFYICINHISKGNFIGGSIIDLETLCANLNFKADEIEKELKEIIKKIKIFTGYSFGQFDSLFYKERDKVNWYKVVEINQRKTMAQVVYKCHKYFGEGNFYFSREKIHPSHISLSPPDFRCLKSFYECQ